MGQRQPKDESESSPAKITHAKSPTREKAEGDAQAAAGTSEGKKVIDYGKDPEIAKARSRYMAWYQQKRSEMERKRKEKKEAEEEQQKPKWLKRAAQAGKSRKAKSAEDGDKSAGDAKVESRRRVFIIIECSDFIVRLCCLTVRIIHVKCIQGDMIFLVRYQHKTNIKGVPYSHTLYRITDVH